MKLSHGIHLGYCTNIHRGEDWPETFAALSTHTSRVRQAVSPGQPFGIGLRLSALAAQELAQPATLESFRTWLDRENAYVFTINGFPYGKFHGTRVKEQVYVPDWTSPERLRYTCLLFDLLAALAPPDIPASVSSLPGSFKDFIHEDAQIQTILTHLLHCHHHIERLRQQSGRDFHLGLEPEPLGLFETTEETLRFFDHLASSSDDPGALLRNIGVNYDTCHLAVEFEDASASLHRLTQAGIRLSKLHLSSALALSPEPAALNHLRTFEDEVYLHQVVDRSPTGELRRFRDIDAALLATTSHSPLPGAEWRVHFHIPLHSAPAPPFRDTRDHLTTALDWLAEHPTLCQHLEMETYTWEVLPPELRSQDVVEQLTREYVWTLDALQVRRLA